MTSKHVAIPETQSHIYEYCRCGAVRHLTAKGYDAWHVCDKCSSGAACKPHDLAPVSDS